MTYLLIAITLLPCADQPADAQTTTKPGRLTKDSDLYSGPGTHYYPVIRANQDQILTVTVEKHGWLGIIPPAGTFSLVAREFVDTTGNGKLGVINDNQVWIHAGSTLSSKNFVKQVRLRKGDRVEILGKRDAYYMIVPPDTARLWVLSRLVEIIEEPTEAIVVTEEIDVVPEVAVAQREVPAKPAERAAKPARQVEPPRTPAIKASGSAREEVERLENMLRAEYAKNILDRDLAPIIGGFNALAEQEADEETIAYADYRANQLIKVTRRVDAYKRLQMLDQQVKEQRRQSMIDRADIRPNPPLVTRDYAVTGKLLMSFAYTNPVGPRRFRLVEGEEPNTRTIAYVEIEPNSEIDPQLYMGRYIGVRARAKRLLQGAVEPVIIYTAAELVVLEQAPVAEEIPAAVYN